jgi:hypothetical protein
MGPSFRKPIQGIERQKEKCRRYREKQTIANLADAPGKENEPGYCTGQDGNAGNDDN